MPDATVDGTIHPEALKTARESQPTMTQQQLADAVGCTKDTVSRWERGKSSRVQSRYREPLRAALGVKKWEDLTKPPKRTADAPEDKDVPYHVWIKFLAGKGMHTALHLVALRYDIHRWDVLKIAPLLFLIVAERSLLERKRRLDDIEAKMGEAEQSFPSHMIGIVAGRNEYGEDPTEEERKSIESRDIFGRKLPAPSDDRLEWEEEANPFINFIRALARELPEDAVDSVETYAGINIGSYRIADDTLRECTGISKDDERGEKLLSFIRMGGIDLAACLRAKRNRDDAGYRQWLSEALTHAEEEAKRALKDIEALLDEEAPSAAGDGEPPVSEERSEQ